jgi:hypothetical protein
MNDSPANEAEKAIQQLVEEIRQERTPQRILALSRQLQAALDRLEGKPGGKRTE